MSASAALRPLLGTELPLLQAPMAGVQGSALAIAVCNAGGLGALPCAMLAPDAMRQELATIVAQTKRPFNVNFFCHPQPAPDAAEPPPAPPAPTPPTAPPDRPRQSSFPAARKCLNGRHGCVRPTGSGC